MRFSTWGAWGLLELWHSGPYHLHVLVCHFAIGECEVLGGCASGRARFCSLFLVLFSLSLRRTQDHLSCSVSLLARIALTGLRKKWSKATMSLPSHSCSNSHMQRALVENIPKNITQAQPCPKSWKLNIRWSTGHQSPNMMFCRATRTETIRNKYLGDFLFLLAFVTERQINSPRIPFKFAFVMNMLGAHKLQTADHTYEIKQNPSDFLSLSLSLSYSNREQVLSPRVLIFIRLKMLPFSVLDQFLVPFCRCLVTLKTVSALKKASSPYVSFTTTASGGTISSFTLRLRYLEFNLWSHWR